VIKFRLRNTKTCLYVSEALSVGKLGERHAAELIRALEIDYLVIAVVPRHALLKLKRWNKVHQLGKDGFAVVHNRPSPSAGMRNYDLSAKNISNRKVAFEKK